MSNMEINRQMLEMYPKALDQFDLDLFYIGPALNKDYSLHKQLVIECITIVQSQKYMGNNRSNQNKKGDLVYQLR